MMMSLYHSLRMVHFHGRNHCVGFNTAVLNEYAVDLSLSVIDRIERYVFSDVEMQRCGSLSSLIYSVVHVRLIRSLIQRKEIETIRERVLPLLDTIAHDEEESVLLECIPIAVEIVRLFSENDMDEASCLSSDFIIPLLMSMGMEHIDSVRIFIHSDPQKKLLLTLVDGLQELAAIFPPSFNDDVFFSPIVDVPSLSLSHAAPPRLSRVPPALRTPPPLLPLSLILLSGPLLCPSRARRSSHRGLAGGPSHSPRSRRHPRQPRSARRPRALSVGAGGTPPPQAVGGASVGRPAAARRFSLRPRRRLARPRAGAGARCTDRHLQVGATGSQAHAGLRRRLAARLPRLPRRRGRLRGAARGL